MIEYIGNLMKNMKKWDIIMYKQRTGKEEQTIFRR